MSLQNVPRCQHLKVNGIQCGSPALRGRRHCFFHHRMLDGKRRFAAAGRMKPRPLFSMALLEDANSVQIAIMQVLSQLGCGQIEPETASVMLRGLRAATLNLRRTNFEPYPPTDIVIDRSAVARTSIRGPQWIEKDFEASPSEEENEQPEQEIEEPNQPAEPKVALDLNVVLVAKHLQAEAERLETQEETRQIVAAARKKVHGVISNYVMDVVRSGAAAPPDNPN